MWTLFCAIVVHFLPWRRARFWRRMQIAESLQDRFLFSLTYTHNELCDGRWIIHPENNQSQPTSHQTHRTVYIWSSFNYISVIYNIYCYIVLDSPCMTNETKIRTCTDIAWFICQTTHILSLFLVNIHRSVYRTSMFRTMEMGRFDNKLAISLQAKCDL